MLRAVIRRCRAVATLGPGSLQSWVGEVITVLREAHQAVEQARARGDNRPLDPENLVTATPSNCLTSGHAYPVN